MSDEQLLVASWDNASPSGVSYAEHISSLSLVMVQMYFSTGGKGVFLTNPMVVSMLLSATCSYMGPFKWDGPTGKSIAAGRMGGVPIWVNMLVPPNEILVVEDPDDLQPHAKLLISNFINAPAVLDRLAQL